MARNWWESSRLADEEDNWWESSALADEPRRDAGGGRGFVNPPMVYEPQPTRNVAPPRPAPAPAPIDYGQAAMDMMGTPITTGRSVLDEPGPPVDRTKETGFMLRPEFVEEVRNSFASVPPEKRRDALIAAASGESGVNPKVALAARRILEEVKAEDATLQRESLLRKGMIDLVANAPRVEPPPPKRGKGATPPAPARVNFPDMTPSFFDTMDGVPEAERVQRRLREDEATRAVVAAETSLEAIASRYRDAEARRNRTPVEYIQDLGTAWDQGLVLARQVIANSIDPASDWAAELRDKAKAAEENLTPQKRFQAQQIAARLAEQPSEWSKFGVMLAELVTNPTLAAEELVRQGPILASMIAATAVGGKVGGAVVARGVMAAAPRVALADAISGGVVSGAIKAGTAAATARGAAAVAAGGDAAGQVYEELTSKKQRKAMEASPDVQRLVEEGKNLDEAIQEVALTKARLAQGIAAAGGALFGAAGFEGLLAKRIGGQAAQSSGKRAAATEIGTEVLDELGTQGASNLAIQQVDPNRSLTEGFGQTAATTVVTTAPLAGAAAYMAGRDPAVDPLTDAYARARLSTANPSEDFISPLQTMRSAADVGPAPLAPGVANFTPPDSPTKQAGLVDIVVPLPGGVGIQALGDLNVGATGTPGGLAAAGGLGGSGLVGGSLGPAGPGELTAAGGGGGATAGVRADGGQTVSVGGSAGQPLASLNRPLERASDANLLARADAASAAAPAEIWAGRAGGGYAQPQDAQQALPKLQTRYPDLTWTLQQSSSGRFFWSGTTRGDASGAAVTGAAGEGLAGAAAGSGAQQPRAAGAGVVDLGQVGGNQPGLPRGAATVGGASPDEPVFTLKLAPPAPLRAAGQAITLLKTDRGVDVELTDTANLTEQQKVASAMGRLVGKTITYLDRVGGKPENMPNGFVIPGKEQNIYLDSKSDDGALFVMMHEGVHALPQPIREKLVTTIKGLTKTEMRGDFAKNFGYDINNEEEIDNEIAAFMTQAVSKRQDFWQELRTKMGDGDFVEVAKVIIEKIDTFINGAKSAYGDEFVKRYATDAVAVRDAVSTAYADAMKAQGLQVPAAADAVTASNRQAPEGARPYGNAPDSLMGFRKSQPNKPFNEQSYKHVEFVRVSWPDGTSMLEAQRGLNKAHALERARRNWSDAESVIAVPREIAKGEDPTLVRDVDSMMGGGITASNRAADVNKLGMYSELARKLDAGPNQAPVDQWKAYIKGLPQKGVKPDEIEWSGVEDFLELKRAAGQKVTKAEVAEYLKQGGVKVEETVLGVDGTKDYGDLFVDEIGRNEWAVFGENSEGQIGGTFATRADAQRAMQSMLEENKPTKYGKYTLPGGENYREVLLTLPLTASNAAGMAEAARLTEKANELDKQAMAAWERSADLNEFKRLDAQARELRRQAAAAEKAGGTESYKYQSKHWDQPNVLAHIRVNDRTDAEGKRVLFVEELQSDWGQEGKKQGFGGKTVSGFKFDDARNDWVKVPDAEATHFGDASGQDDTLWNSREEAKRKLKAGVPSAPFITKTEGWLNLALKRIMVMAAEGGYDKVAFVNGEQSADRYDLSKQIERIDVYLRPEGTYDLDVATKDGRDFNRSALTETELENNVGKEMAQKIVGSVSDTNRRARFNNLDLKVGGEGMKTFYDTIVPTAVKKLLPKVGGGQMGKVNINSEFNVFQIDEGLWGNNVDERTFPSEKAALEAAGMPQPGFDVTPAMREKVVTTGLPMFSNRKVEEPGSAAPAEGKRVGSVDTHILAAVRGERSMADRTVLSAEEKTKIRAGAAKLKVPASEVEAQVREHKAAHPVEDGWAPLTFTGVKKNEDTGKYDLQYKTVPYEFSNGANGKALQPGTPAYKAQVDRLASGMQSAVRAVYQRALDGDAAARKIIDQSGWYKEMRTRLRQEFGGLGDLFADLLGATSPNTPVRTNWDNSVEALRLLSQGKFDNLVPQWIAWAQGVDEVETRFRAWFNERLKSGMSKAAIKKTSEYKEFAREAAAARELPDNLMPTKANGKKFGFNGGNVVRAVVDLWRVVKNADPDINRGGTAPKAINFSGNLIGFRARATIDVWAARMLQRLAGGPRIPSMAEGGVSGQALENGRNTLQFGFGQDVFSEAVKLIRNDPELSQDSTLNSINDDDLQALVWFIEKEVWTKGNWTSAAGEGGSFELESDLAGIRDREVVTELRRVADSSVSSTAEQRQQATDDIDRLRQEIENLPAIVQANEVLERNAQRVAASKTAKREDKLTPAQMAEIKAENAAARKAIVKARSSAAAKSIEKQIAKAQRTLKKPTVEESQATRAAAVGKLKEMARTVDRFVGGLSIQQGDQQPTDAAMAGLAKSIEDAVISVDDGATVIGLKAISTQGRYGSVERALDMEVIARAGFNARPMAAAVFTAARDANQDSAFVARVLRPDEQFDPLKHRPGIEIYFRDMKQAEEAAKMMAKIAGKRIAKATEVGPGFFEVSGYTVVVDGRRTPTTRSGAMGTPVGMRIIYMPEFEARYGSDPRLADATENNIRDIVNERADNLGNFASEVLRAFDGVSFAGRFNYEVDTRFAGEYQGAIDAYSSAAATAGTDQSRSQAWQGRPVRESVAAAVGRVSVDGSQQGGELSGGDQIRASNRIVGDGGGRDQGRSLAPLPGAPVIEGATGPDPKIVEVAEQYARDNGIPLRRQAEYVRVDPARAKRISSAYEVMRHAPQDPKVKEAYENLVRQTVAQYKALERAGYKFWFFDDDTDPYAGNPWNAMRDLRATQSMGVYATEAGFGSNAVESDNAMLVDTGLQWPYGAPDGPLKRVLANDLFRAVHDAFGHGMEGAGFREQGEENAWQAHARLYTGSALGAITSETRGQNSWLNYGPYGEKNRTAKVEDTVFADQKTGLMPEWTWTEGRAGDMPGITASNRGINIRNDGDNRYADLIVDGQKTMESRTTDSLRPYVGRTVGIIRTGEGPAKLIGSARIGEPIKVDERQFRELEGEHLVPRGSAFDIKPGQTKFLYPITDAVRFDQERDVTSRGIVAREVEFSSRGAAPKLDKDVVALFKDLDGARGLSLIRARERVDAHPMAETIRRVNDEFLDILERLDDAGLVKINCK